jgi:hypothetical protein
MLSPQPKASQSDFFGNVIEKRSDCQDRKAVSAGEFTSELRKKNQRRFKTRPDKNRIKKIHIPCKKNFSLS